jgi:hypothetical protein
MNTAIGLVGWNSGKLIEAAEKIYKFYTGK